MDASNSKAYLLSIGISKLEGRLPRFPCIDPPVSYFFFSIWSILSYVLRYLPKVYFGPMGNAT